MQACGSSITAETKAMYRIQRQGNKVEKLKKCTFRELGFREREHLQEWIAKDPEVLGEELLIVQKEFSGFSDTNERLDLLALDKQGSLVIIENKLDDTGRDVVMNELAFSAKIWDRNYCRDSHFCFGFGGASLTFPHSCDLISNRCHG